MATEANATTSTYPLPPSRYYGSTTPPRPPTSTYSLFGQVYSVHDTAPSLTAHGRPVLYSSDETAQVALRRLNRRLLSLFVACVRSLSDVDSNDTNELVTGIEHVLVNMHHIVNLLRPTYARADVLAILKRQTETRRKAAAQLRAVTAAARSRTGVALRALRTPPSIPTPPVLDVPTSASSAPPDLTLHLTSPLPISAGPSSGLPPLPSPGTDIQHLL